MSCMTLERPSLGRAYEPALLAGALLLASSVPAAAQSASAAAVCVGSTVLRRLQAKPGVWVAAAHGRLQASLLGVLDGLDGVPPDVDA